MKERVTFGFWVYLMSDCVLFASLFATYAVLAPATAGGPGIADFFDIKFVFIETLLLLTSSYTIGLAMVAAKAQKVGRTDRRFPERTLFVLLAVTLLLGLAFLAMEVSEFRHLIAEGYGPSRSAFLSSFFTLVGTHGLHVFLGSLWMIVLMAHILLRGLGVSTLRKLACLSLFWHFLDIIWIFIFTFVYLFGAL